MERTMCSTRSGLLFFLLCGFAVWGSVSSANVPCAARQETSGYVCVCNTTYCDTIARPKALKSGKYYHYVTSATQPGFNVETGSFKHEREPQESTSVKFVVDESLKYQTFEGIGAGFTDSAAINFNILAPKLQNNFIQSFFSVNGLEYVFCRIPIGATDFSTRSYTYDDVPGDVNLTHFQLVDEDLKLRIPMIKKAKKVSKRGLKLLATSWSAPAWMKVNNSSFVGFLKREYESVYAQYFLRYLEEYKKQGLDFWGITHGNEILMGFQAHFHMPNLVFMPPQVKTWSRDYFGPLIKNSPFADLKIITNDDERPYLDWYARELLDDEATSQYVDGAALHWYFDSETNTYILDNFHNNYPDKFLIYTESSLGGGGPHSKKSDASDLGSWSNAERYISNVIQNFNHFVVGYMDWNICLNEDGGPYQQMSLDPSVVVNATTGKEFYKQPFFYVLGHFSKFLAPGAQRINVTSDQKSSFSQTDEFLDNFVMDVGVRPTGQPGPRPTGQPGPGPYPTGQPGPRPTGQPGPGPYPTGQPGPGPHPTGQPGPGPGPRPTTAPLTTLLNTAALNPDGSHTFIVYNPLSESVDITITDKQKGTITKTLTPQSLNTFLYW